MPKDMRHIGGSAVEVKMQENVSKALQPFVNSPIADGVLLESVALINGVTEINHKLGRAPRGWLIVRQRASASIWDVQDENTRPKLTLKLQSNAAVICDIWIF